MRIIAGSKSRAEVRPKVTAVVVSNRFKDKA